MPGAFATTYKYRQIDAANARKRARERAAKQAASAKSDHVNYGLTDTHLAAQAVQTTVDQMTPPIKVASLTIEGL